MNKNRDDLQIGQSISHPTHGECIITYLGENYIGAQLDNNTQALLRADSFYQESEAEKPITEENVKPSTWPENTFFFDTDDIKHFMGSHWSPFYENSGETLKRIPEIIENSQVLQGYGSFIKSPLKDLDSWAKGFHYVWPDVHKGLITTLKIMPHSNSIISIYPYADVGIQTTLSLQSVSVWEHGVEAQINAHINGVPISFFDSHFLVNRSWYESGKSYDFILLGIAYDAIPSSIMEIPYQPNPEQIAWQTIIAEQAGEEPPMEADTIQLKGAAFFMEIPEWDNDDYSFRGLIKSVKPVSDFLGQDGWVARVTVMRIGEDDIDLDVLITQRIWEGDSPPEQGQDIEGSLWLQGRLWQPHS